MSCGQSSLLCVAAKCPLTRRLPPGTGRLVFKAMKTFLFKFANGMTIRHQAWGGLQTVNGFIC